MSTFSEATTLVLHICLIGVIFTAGCSEKPGSVTAGQAVSGQTTESGTATPTPGSGTATSSITWISTPSANSSGEALLSGAKTLMKEIYTYSPNAPDYLPGSYSSQNSYATAYVKHAINISTVVWAPVGQNQIIWISNPGTSPKGWSGTVVSAGSFGTNGKPEAVHVYTDCSGFITSLFTYANTDHTTKFTRWKTGNPIPEAGCNDPQGSCIVPNPLNYYHLFVTGQNGWFQNVALADLQPGDIIAYANTKNKRDSGHIMLVAAVSTGRDNSTSRYVVVIDETQDAHSSDTRIIKKSSSGAVEGAGVGMGIVKLSNYSDGSLQFFWGLTSPKPEVGSIALGRAL